MRRQVRCLAHKDVQVLAKYKRKLVGELLFPLVIGAISGFLLCDVINMLAAGNRISFSGADDVNVDRSRPCAAWNVLMDTELVETAAFDCLWSSAGRPHLYNTSEALVAAGAAASGARIGVWGNDTWQLFGGGLDAPGTVRLAQAALTFVASGAPQPVDQHITETFIITSNLRVLVAAAAAVICTISFGPFLTATAGRLVDEKQTGVRDYLFVMGARPAAYALSTLVVTGVRAVTGSTALVGVLALYVRGVGGPASAHLRACDLIGVWLLAISLALALSGVARIVPALCSRATTASALCYVFLTAGAVGAPFSTALDGAAQAAFAVFFPPVTFVYGAAQLLSSGRPTLAVSPAAAGALLLGQWLVLSAVGEYLWSLFPGQHGAAMPALWPIQFCQSLFTRASRRDDETPLHTIAADGETAVCARDVVVQYGHTVAVDGMTLIAGSGEIVALLGHNGAGKTTFLSALLGLRNVTAATALAVAGHSVSAEPEGARQRVSVCPQFDLLFDELTAEQHIDLILGLKNAECDVGTLLSDLDLPTHQRAGGFSGGTKRRLSVAMALAPRSTVVVLDEPSSGLDPVSRHRLWDAIRKCRDGGSCVILTTHFMEEADALGDRIVIMVDGRERCAGTSQHLKQTHGVGYHLMLNSKPACALDADRCATVLQSTGSGATIAAVHGADLEVLLPTSDTAVVAATLNILEETAADLNIGAISVGLDTLEDVFLKVTADRAVGSTAQTGPAELPDLPASAALPCSSVAGTMWKKLATLRRTPRLWIMSMLVPTAFVVGGYEAIFPSPFGGPLPPQSERFPDMDQHIPVFLNSDCTECVPAMAVDRLLDEWSRAYTAQFPQRRLRFQHVRDGFDQATGNYIRPDSISFLYKRPTPLIAILHNVRNASHVQVTWWFDSWDYSRYYLFDTVLPFHLAALGIATGVKLEPVVNITTFRAANGDAPPPPPPPSHKDWILAPLGVLVVLAVSQFVGSAAVQVADELCSGMFDVFRIGGLRARAFWCAHVVADTVIFLPTLFVFCVYPFARNKVPMQGPLLPFAAVCLACFVVNSLLVGYAIVYALPRNLKPSTYVVAVATTISLSMALPLLVQVINQQAHTGHPQEAWDETAWVSYVFPARAFMMITTLNPRNCPWSTADGKRTLASVICWSCAPMLGLLWLSSLRDWFQRRRLSRRQHTASHDDDSDTDQHEEHDDSDRRSLCVLGCEALRVVYKVSKQRLVAMRNATLYIGAGECVALLGPNGAGKTSAVQSMLLLAVPDAGRVLGFAADGTLDDKYNAATVAACLQFGGLNEALSAREHLQLALRGRGYEGCRAYADACCAAMGLDPDKLVRECSGGMKRKLSVCIAIFCGATAACLDEPSTGMDPVSRRALWLAIHNAKRRGVAVLLTTHSMEEADAVSDRVAIAVSSRLRCIGTPHDLKSRFAGGYKISVDTTGVCADIDAIVADCVGQRCQAAVTGNSREYSPATSFSIPAAFRRLELARAAGQIESFSVSQTATLEQVFMSVARRFA